jgi:hypothetical protein
LLNWGEVFGLTENAELLPRQLPLR